MTAQPGEVAEAVFGDDEAVVRPLEPMGPGHVGGLQS